MADWVAIKTEYVTGDISQRKLAEKYGVSLRAVANHAKAEEWAQQRKQHCDNVAMQVQQKSAEKISDAESEIAAIKARARLKIWAEIERRMGSPPDEMEGADFRRMVQNYCDMSNAEPDNSGPADATREDELSRSLRELGKELESDD